MPNAFHPHNTNPSSRYPQAWDRASRIKLLVLDVDGVLTNGQVFIGLDGKESFKAFDIQDGFGIKLLQKVGIPTALITGRESQMVLGRCRELDIDHVHMGVKDKATALAEILKAMHLQSTDCAVMGDDWPDLAMMKSAGLRVCPAQAHVGVKDSAHYVTDAAGGSGAVREVCDLILKAQNQYEGLLAQARG